MFRVITKVAIERGAEVAVGETVHRVLADHEPREVLLEVVKRDMPLGRERTPEHLGHLAAFLAGDAARSVSGQWIAVNGGVTLRQSA